MADEGLCVQNDSEIYDEDDEEEDEDDRDKNKKKRSSRAKKTSKKSATKVPTLKIKLGKRKRGSSVSKNRFFNVFLHETQNNFKSKLLDESF